jgi:H+/Cl- antiporter ClcA
MKNLYFSKSGGVFPWIARSLILGFAVGPIIALLTKIVEIGAELHTRHPYLLFAIPLGALATALLYQKLGPYLKEGNNQVITMINQGIVDMAHPTSIGYENDQERHFNRISTKMAPLLLVNTFITHLVGASGGKEGAGVQLGSSIGSYFEGMEKRIFHRQDTKLLANQRGIWLISGAGAAFGALFNAPVAGTLFGLQFSSPRVNRTDAILPCFLSSTTSCLVSQALHIHTLAPIQVENIEVNLNSLSYLILLSLVLGLISRLFCSIIHLTKKLLGRVSPKPMVQVLLSSLLLLGLSVAIFLSTNSNEYIGMSTNLIRKAGLGTSQNIAPILKLLLTALTIGSGFVGGEVIPIMVIGATTGSFFAHFIPLSFSSMAMFGAIGMLSGATKLPLACFVLGLELFGYGNPLTLFLVCTLSYVASGKLGIYEKQIAPVSIDETWEA